MCWRDRFVLLRRYDRIWPSLKILIISSKEGEKERNAIVSINFFIKRVESEIKRLVGKRREEGACDLQQAISLRVAWSRRKSLTCLCYILRKLRFLRLQPSFFFSSFARKSSLFLHLYLVKVAFLSSRNWSERSSERPARGRADYRKVSGGEVSIRVTHILGFRYVLHLRRNDPRVDIPRFQHFWRFEGNLPSSPNDSEAFRGEKGDFESPRIMNPSPSRERLREGATWNGRKNSGEIDRSFSSFFSSS